MKQGKNGLYEHQRLNFNVFRVSVVNGALKHCYARNQDQWFPCKRKEWANVLDDLTEDTWFLGLMLYKPAASKDDTSFEVLKVRDISALHVDPLMLNKRLWEWANERYDNNWLPNNDPRFMRMYHWIAGTKYSAKEHTQILDAIIEKLDTMKDPVLPSTRDFFLEMLNTQGPK